MSVTLLMTVIFTDNKILEGEECRSQTYSAVMGSHISH